MLESWEWLFLVKLSLSICVFNSYHARLYGVLHICSLRCVIICLLIAIVSLIKSKLNILICYNFHSVILISQTLDQTMQYIKQKRKGSHKGLALWSTYKTGGISSIFKLKQNLYFTNIIYLNSSKQYNFSS